MLKWRLDSDEAIADVPSESGTYFRISQTEGGHSVSLHRYSILGYTLSHVEIDGKGCFETLQEAFTAADQYTKGPDIDFECLNCDMQGFELDENWRCAACAVGAEHGEDARNEFIDAEIVELEAWHRERQGAVADAVHS